MLVKFKVHGVNKIQTPMQVDAGGEKVVANVPAIEVELTTESNLSGSLTLRFFGKDMAEAEKLYVVDDFIEADFLKN